MYEAGRLGGVKGEAKNVERVCKCSKMNVICDPSQAPARVCNKEREVPCAKGVKYAWL
jgi:hypothetical protein